MRNQVVTVNIALASSLLVVAGCGGSRPEGAGAGTTGESLFRVEVVDTFTARYEHGTVLSVLVKLTNNAPYSFGGGSDIELHIGCPQDAIAHRSSPPQPTIAALGLNDGYSTNESVESGTTGELFAPPVTIEPNMSTCRDGSAAVALLGLDLSADALPADQVVGGGVEFDGTIFTPLPIDLQAAVNGGGQPAVAAAGAGASTIPEPTGPVGPMPVVSDGCLIIPTQELSALLDEELEFRPGGFADAQGLNRPTREGGAWLTNYVGFMNTYCDYRLVGTSGASEQTRILVSRTFDTREGAGAFYGYKTEIDDLGIGLPDVELTIPNVDEAVMAVDSSVQRVLVWCDTRYLEFTALSATSARFSEETLEEIGTRFVTGWCPSNYVSGDPVPLPVDPNATTTTAPPSTTTPAPVTTVSAPVTPSVAPTGNQVATIIDDIGAAYPMTCDELSNRLTGNDCTDIDQAFFNRLVMERIAGFNDYYVSGVVEVAHNDEPLWIAALGFQACKAYQSGAGLSDFVTLLDREMVGYTHEEAAQIYALATTIICPISDQTAD